MQTTRQDKKFLVNNRWTIAREERDGFIKRVYWRDPVQGAVMVQSAAVYLETKRQYNARLAAKGKA